MTQSPTTPDIEGREAMTDERRLARPVEEVARALLRAKGAGITASDKHWPEAIAHYHEMVAKWPEHAAAHSLINDVVREAQAAIGELRRLGFINDIGLTAIKAEESTPLDMTKGAGT